MAHLGRYLEQLPEGIDSHSHTCRSKVGPLNLSIDLRPFRLSEDVPVEVLGLVSKRRVMNDWVSSVHYYATFVAQADALGFDDDAFREYFRELSVALANSRLYRFLFRQLSPRTIARTVSLTWGNFHRGLPLRYISEDSTHERFFLSLEYPEGLIDRRLGHAMAGTFEGVLVPSKLAQSQIEMIEHTQTASRYVVNVRDG